MYCMQCLSGWSTEGAYDKPRDSYSPLVNDRMWYVGMRRQWLSHTRRLFPDYLEVEGLYGKTGSWIILLMKSQFARHGIPDKVMSDNGPPHGSREFAEFEHFASLPRYEQSNGKTGNSVKIATRLLHKCAMDTRDPFFAFLDLRNAPTQGIGYSLAERIFGRRTKTLLPVAEHLLKPRHVNHT